MNTLQINKKNYLRSEGLQYLPNRCQMGWKSLFLPIQQGIFPILEKVPNVYPAPAGALSIRKRDQSVTLDHYKLPDPIGALVLERVSHVRKGAPWVSLGQKQIPGCARTAVQLVLPHQKEVLNWCQFFRCSLGQKKVPDCTPAPGLLLNNGRGIQWALLQ